MAAALLIAGGLTVVAGSARAQQAAPAGAVDNGGVQLAPQGGCSACERPLAQAGVTGASPQALPATPAPAATFRLNGVRLTGAQAVPADELRVLVQPYIGREVTLADLEALAQAITARYRGRGYFLAQAVVPVQTVQGGVVEISVVEGRLGNVEVHVAPDAPLTEQRVRAFLAPLVPGKAVNGPAYERAMLLLSDQPGVRVTSSLQEGKQAGTTDLTVDVAAAPRWAFTAEADNNGTLETGRYRAGGTVRWLSPLGIGDNLDLRLLVSNSNALQFGRLAYEVPLGSNGWRVGVGLMRTSYELGGSFSQLGAHGTAEVADVSLSYPVIRQRTQNLFLRVTADVKNLHDTFDAVDFNSRKRTRGVGAGWTWERRDDLLGGGYWASTGTLYQGQLDFRDPTSQQLDQGSTGLHTQGAFTKFTWKLSRLQAVLPRQSLYLSVGGQTANKNLDASEKLSLGGANAVRAYPSGEVLADQGVIGTVEWRWSYNAELTPFVFYDAAHGSLSREPLPFSGPNTRSLRGAGIGLSWARPGNFSINATLAWRSGTPAAVTDGGGHNPRLFVQAQKMF